MFWRSSLKVLNILTIRYVRYDIWIKHAYTLIVKIQWDLYTNQIFISKVDIHDSTGIPTLHDANYTLQSNINIAGLLYIRYTQPMIGVISIITLVINIHGRTTTPTIIMWSMITYIISLQSNNYKHCQTVKNLSLHTHARTHAYTHRAINLHYYTISQYQWYIFMSPTATLTVINAWSPWLYWCSLRYINIAGLF